MFKKKTNIQLNFWHGFIVMGIIAIILFIRSCNSNNKYEKDIQTVLDYIENDTVKQYYAKDGTVVDYNSALQVQFDAFLDAQSDSVRKYLKNIRIPRPDVITVYSDRFYVDSIPSVSLNNIANCKFDTTFFIQNPWYNIKGRLTNKELKFGYISIPNKSTIVIGDSKQKWWKQREYIVTVDNSNPYIKTESIQSYTFKEKQSRLSIGPSFGYGFYYDPWKGNIGHGFSISLGLNYRLIGWKKK